MYISSFSFFHYSNVVIVFILLLASFSPSVSWLSFTWIRVTASLFWSLRLFSVSRLISTMLQFGWSRLDLRFPTFPIFETVQSTLITIGITMTLMFHRFISFLARSKTLLIFLFFIYSSLFILYNIGRHVIGLLLLEIVTFWSLSE